MEFLPDLSLASAMAGLLLLTILAALLLFALLGRDYARPLLLNRMIARAGGKIDPAGDPLIGEKLASAARACSRCRDYDECEILLTTGKGQEIPDYCPNRRWIDSLPHQA